MSYCTCNHDKRLLVKIVICSLMLGVFRRDLTDSCWNNYGRFQNLPEVSQLKSTNIMFQKRGIAGRDSGSFLSLRKSLVVQRLSTRFLC